MSRPYADNRFRSNEDPPPEELQQQLLKQVLSATSEARRAGAETIGVRYQQVVDRWRGTPWSPETIGVSLVGVALEHWLSDVKLSESAREQLILEITQGLCDDPNSVVKLQQWWQELQERKG